MLVGRGAVIVYAHRGASMELPENTIEAFSLALELGVDALEGDVHVTRDGHVVVAHDDDGARMAGEPARIAESSLDEVRRWDVGARFVPRRTSPSRRRGPYRIATLAELLEALPEARLNLDLKAPAAVAEAVRVVRRAGATSRVLLTSFSSATVRSVRALGYEGPTGLGRDEVLAAIALGPLALGPLRPRGHRAQLPSSIGGVRIARPALVARLHALGLHADFWGVDDPREALAIERAGADGVMTDDPRTIVAALRSRS